MKRSCTRKEGNQLGVLTKMACTIAITSGKGGVGKTNAATNIGVALRRLGRKVCIFDADLGLSNVNILTGLSPAATVEQLLDGSCTLEEIVMAGPAGVHVVPSGSGIENLTELAPERMGRLSKALNQLGDEHDYLLIDTAAGIGNEVLWFVKSAQAAVIAPGGTSWLDILAAADVVAIERARQSLAGVIKDNLDEREQYIILNHFGLLGSAVKKESKTLRQIGEDLVGFVAPEHCQRRRGSHGKRAVGARNGPQGAP